MKEEQTEDVTMNVEENEEAQVPMSAEDKKQIAKEFNLKCKMTMLREMSMRNVLTSELLAAAYDRIKVDEDSFNVENPKENRKAEVRMTIMLHVVNSGNLSGDEVLKTFDEVVAFIDIENNL